VSIWLSCRYLPCTRSRKMQEPFAPLARMAGSVNPFCILLAYPVTGGKSIVPRAEALSVVPFGRDGMYSN
jgi:hypothetical protein